MAFRLLTLNLNGIRSAASKGFVEWSAQTGADCMGVQELKAQADDVAETASVDEAAPAVEAVRVDESEPSLTP